MGAGSVMLKNIKLFFTKIHRSKTLIFAMALAVGGVIEANTQVFAPYMTPQTFGLFTTGVGVVMALLRFATTKPLEDK